MSTVDTKKVWGRVKEVLNERHPAVGYREAVKRTLLEDITEENATIIVDNQTLVGFIGRYLETSILQALSEVLEQPVRSLTIVVKSKRKEVPQSTTPLFVTDTPGGLQPNQEVTANLNPRFTLQSFINGRRNQLAYAAAQAVAENPGHSYNPLYLYGGVGVGKTHLMQAIGNAIVAADPRKQVLYVTSEAFTNEFVASIRTGHGKEEFKRKYRNVDVLLVDDIQFLAGKDGTQEEFFHTFNALTQKNRQIIITSDRRPVDIADLEERLSSRFGMGLIADMGIPDTETRLAILQAKCQEKGILLPNDVLEQLAEHVDTSIRELEGALSRAILQFQALGKTEPSMADVREVLQGVLPEQRLVRKSNHQELLKIVADFYNCTSSDVLGARRHAEIVKPRQVYMYLLKHELGFTFPQIGREVGGRDHTTAMHSVEKIEKGMKKSDELLDEIQAIREQFYAR